MECNKEEALHAREIALMKLKTKDFLGAKRIALKAQRLYPKLENLSQLLTICEVHCAAEVKVNGYMDWYGILQVEATSDETIIRKGYEKLALLLHHGKNSLPSAQAAFNLVSEAHTILCDHVKRSQYDIKSQCGKGETCANKSELLKHIPPSDCVKVFWTICPHCRNRFVYHQRNLVIRCEDCSKNFFAFNLHEVAVPSRFLAAPNNSQVPSEIFATQKHGGHNPKVQYSKPYPTGGSETMMHARQRDEHVEWDCMSDGDQGGSCSATRSGMVECLATNLIHSPAPSVIERTTRRMMPDPPDPHFVATQNLSREDASTVLNDAGSDSLERSGKRRQDDGANDSHSKDSYNKRVKKCNSLANADSGGDKMSSDNVVGTDSESAEHLPSKVDSQGDENATHEGNASYSSGKMCNDNVARIGSHSVEHCPSKVDSQGDENATHEGNANYSNGKMFNDNIAGIGNHSVKHCPSKVDSQGDGNATHEQNTDHSDDKMFNGSVASADNLSTEHLHNKVGRHGDGNDMFVCNVNSGDDEICNGNVASSRNESAEYFPREMGSQEDGNTTYDGTANCEDFKMFNDSVACVGNQSIEYLSSRVDIQGDGNATHEGNANRGRGKASNEIAVGSNNQSSEHYHRELDSQGDGNAAQKCNANSDTVTNQGNVNSEDNAIVGEKSCYSRCLSMPVPNIFDFEKFRDVTWFEVGQIWAVYDRLDGMPRFYARILQLNASDFKVHLAWLEHDAANKEEEKWTDEELPVACGKFCLRKTRDISPDRSMFSHIVEWTEGKETNSYVIYPIKGEIWALYKSWSMEWGSDADNHRSYEYEVVEVLSNISADGGATVIPLVRIKGFVSLFAIARDKFSFTIPSSELLKFSHRIPFYRTTGNETVGAPGGFLVLDTAALPTDLNAAFPSVTLESYMSPSSMLADLRTDSTTGSVVLGTEHIALEKNHCEAHLPMGNHKVISSEQDTSLQKYSHGATEFGDGSSQHKSLSPITFTYPESAFHNFEELRSCARFERGQIWALYSDVDKLPKFYGWVSEVEMDPFKVHLTWLEACPKEEQEKQWVEQGIGPSCGTFQVRNFDWRSMYDTTDVFSHVVNARKNRKKWHFEIRLQVGEVWAIYLNWSPDWVPSSTEHAEYAIGKIRRCTKSSTMFEFLTKVDGYVAVFKHDSQKGALNIPATENLRFSHQIPAFRLTEENGGELRGFYELDPAAVPEVFLAI